MQFDFNISANGGMNIETAGRFVKYVSGAGKIRVRFDKGGYIDLLPGQGANGLDFSRLTIEDRSGAINGGVLLAGTFAFQDDRISGTVDVIDGARNNTIAGKAFMRAGGCGQVAGTYAAWQIWNPAGSGKRLVVSQWMTSPNNATAPVVFRPGTIMLPNLGYLGRSKLAQSPIANSVAELRFEARAAVAAQGDEFDIDYPFCTANTSFTRTLKEPVVIMPGAGVYMQNTAVAVSINGTWEWTEEAI